jgi:hypothetical protein
MNPSESVPIWVYPLAGGVLLTAAIVAGVRAYMTRSIERRNQERIESIAYEVLRNVLIPNGSGGQLHLNYLLRSVRWRSDVPVDRDWSQVAFHFFQSTTDSLRPHRCREVTRR